LREGVVTEGGESENELWMGLLSHTRQLHLSTTRENGKRLQNINDGPRKDEKWCITPGPYGTPSIAYVSRGKEGLSRGDVRKRPTRINDSALREDFTVQQNRSGGEKQSKNSQNENLQYDKSKR